MPPAAPGSHDNITDEALDAYSARYGEWVTKDSIFAYVYGILHSPDYRQRYADGSRQATAAHPRSRNGGCLPRVL